MQIRVDLSTGRPVPDVSTQRAMVLTHWRVLTNAQGEHFLTGMLLNQSTLRIMALIDAVDLMSQMWRTQSGRVCGTPGPPAVSPALCYVLALMVRVGDPSTHPRGVTDMFRVGMQHAVQ